ncbi:MAG: hypothetical protein EP326_15330 [Deltaproteobacteria bacterium]|nr:MAG: hypothetical protein EP326_15330 [Deltaproteobacteria bacterium]TNF25526.1 MAG: hypothetical protein EP319_15990 [Deltaproteobacteria bacterium]
MKLVIGLSLFIFSLKTFGAYYTTLPKGVRNLTYRFVVTNEITGSYNTAGDYEGYNINANITADVIKGLSTAVDTYLNGLSTSDYNSFSFGTFEGKATSKVMAHAFGGGYGITDNITVYGFIPFYDAVVDLNLVRTAKGRNNVGSSISLENLPDIDVRIIQNLFVNYYKYQPLGKWEATGWGDAELGTMWSYYKKKNHGAMMIFGVVAPTGREDNPDILQDINFGDGQWDIFLENGGGYRPGNLVSFDAFFRYTYQLPYNKTIRLPESEAFPITSRTGDAKIDLGDKFLVNSQANFHLSDEWTTSFIYLYELKGKDNYQSAYAEADAILEKDTKFKSHTFRLNVNFSTVSLYKKKQFVAPLDVNAAVQSIVGGTNTPKYERFDLELRMFF